MEKLFFIIAEGIWWGPFQSFPEAHKKIKDWCDSVQERIDHGTYSKDYPFETNFEIIEIPISHKTKVKYQREIRGSRVETLDA